MNAPPPPTATTLKRSIGFGTTLAAASEIASLVAGGLTGLVVARSLGPSGTGVYSVVYAFLAALLTCSTLGVEVALLYFIGGGEWKASDAIRQVQVAALLMGVAGLAAGVTIGLLGHHTVFRHIPLGLLIVGVAALPFLLSSTFTAYVVLARGEYGVYALAAAGRGIAALVLVGIGAPLAGVRGAIVGAAVAYPLTAVAIFAWARPRMGPPSPMWLGDSLRALQRAVSLGIRVNFTNILGFINQRADLLILSAYASSASVGRYAIAVAIVNVGWLLPKNLSTVVFPRAAAEVKSGEPTEQSLIDRSVRHSIVLAVLSIPVVTLGLLAVPLVYGGGFAQATTLGLILMPGIASYGVASVLLSGIVATGRSDFALYSSLIVTPLTLVLYFALIPAWGARGAAVASTISYIGSVSMLLVWFRQCTGPRLISRLTPRSAEFGDYLHLAREVSALVRRGARGAST